MKRPAPKPPVTREEFMAKANKIAAMLERILRDLKAEKKAAKPNPDRGAALTME